MKTVTATAAGEHIDDLLREAAESSQPIEIEGSEARGVLVSKDDWTAIQETLFLLSIPGMRESIREGLETPIDDCSETPGW